MINKKKTCLAIPRHIALCALTLVLFCACGKQAARTEDGKDIVLSINIDSLSSARLSVKDVRYIPLETTEASLIGGISKLLYVDNRFYVLDTKGKCVAVFSDTGEYLYRVVRIGQGPGEYVDIKDMDVAPNGDIYVVDNFSQKIIRYSQKGERFEEIPIGQNAVSFSLSSDSSRLYLADMFTESGMIDLARYDIAKGTYTSTKDYEYASLKHIMSWSTSRFFRSGEKVYHYHRFTPYIAIMDSENKFVKLVTDRIPSKEQIMETDKTESMGEVLRSGLIYNIAAFYETNDMTLLLTYAKDIVPQWSFVRKSDPQVSHTFGIQSVPQSLMIFSNFSNICGATDSHFVSYIETAGGIIAQLIQSDPTMSEADSTLLANLGEDDNPVLALFQCEITEEKE
jgi:hypothetical protein